MSKKQAPAPRRATPTASGRPRPKVKPQIRSSAGHDKQPTAADIPGTAQHAQRFARRESASHNQDARRDAAARGRGIRVRAIKDGYYGHSRRRSGDVFTIRTEQEFSKRWMEKVETSTRESITTPNEVIRQKHDETLALKYGGLARGGSPDDSARDEGEDADLDGDDNPLNAD